MSQCRSHAASHVHHQERDYKHIHTLAQFMIVWQRYSLYASSSCARRSFVKSSRLSMIHLQRGIGYYQTLLYCSSCK